MLEAVTLAIRMLQEPCKLHVLQGKTYATDGTLTETFAAPVDVEAVIQPVNGNALRDMEEGTRAEATKSLYIRDADIHLGDRIEKGLEKYRVIHLADWEVGGFTSAVLGNIKP